jgi:hypothetical protein
MKKVTVLLILTLMMLAVGLYSRFWLFSREEYISEKVLEMSTPFSVTIDVDFLKSLLPAYE